MWPKFLCHWSHVCFCVVVEKLVRSCDCERASIKYNLPTLFPLPTTLPLLSLSMHFPFPPIKVPPASSNRVPERRLFATFGTCNTLDNWCGIIFPSTEQFIMIVPRRDCQGFQNPQGVNLRLAHSITYSHCVALPKP